MAIDNVCRLTLVGVALAALVSCQTQHDTRASASPSQPVNWPAINSEIAQDPAIEARIDTLLSQMTLQEKVGQMIQPEIKQVTPADVREYHLGSVLNGGGTTPDNNKYASVQDWVDLADSYYYASVDKSGGRIGIPIIWGTDAVHGVGNVVGATLFPHNIALGATHNPDLLQQVGWVTARELNITGIDWNFSPTVAVARDERWGRTYEAWSEDPEIVGQYAGRMVRGLQGEPGSPELLDKHHVIATAKHFIGDGGTAKGIDRGATWATEQQLRDIHGAGYFSAIKAGVQVVMASFTSWEGTRMHGNRYLLTEVLKGQMGFDGFVVGDWSGHGFIPGCTALDCPQAVNAGLDMYMAPEPEWKQLFASTVKHAQDGTIPMARIDDAVRRILRVKLRAGLFTAGAPSERGIAGRDDLLGAPEHRAVARQAVRESLVLLKNTNGLLPLSRNAKVLVAGDGADNIGKQAGGWSVTWQGTGNKNTDFPGATSIYDGIAKVVNAGGGTATLSLDGSYTQKPDVAIVVFGEDPYAEMQGDLTNLMYKGGDESDLALLKSFQEQGIPVVSLFITGRPLWVNRELNASDAFMVVWQPGTEGDGVAEVVFRDNQGEINHDATGRLSFSWPKHPDQYRLNRGDAPYHPLFAYGFGLSYHDTDTLGSNLPEQGLQQAKTRAVLELFKRRPIAPWSIVAVGKQNDRKVMSSNTLQTSTVMVEAVDRNEQQDARRVVFNGTGSGQVALASSERQDLSGYLHGQAALHLDINVEQAPTQTTYLRLVCGSWCAADIDVTQPMREHLAGNGWQSVSVDLACFPEAGANFGLQQPQSEYITQVFSPFSIYTTGKLTMSFANVRLERGTASDATISCQ
jgi:beta-glucosidase